jgi:phage terminase large subunit
VNTEARVITNYRVEEFDAMELAAAGFEPRNGVDVGWVDKTAIILSLYDKENKTIYVYDEYYKSGSQLNEIAAAAKEMNIGKTKLYVDNSEPRTIQYLRQEGLNAHPCSKGKDSVKAGYMFLQDHLIVVHPKCENLIIEFENLCYAKSKLTGEFTDEFLDHSYTHACDALRYGCSDIYTSTKLKTLNKTAFSL